MLTTILLLRKHGQIWIKEDKSFFESILPLFYNEKIPASQKKILWDYKNIPRYEHIHYTKEIQYDPELQENVTPSNRGSKWNYCTLCERVASAKHRCSNCLLSQQIKIGSAIHFPFDKFEPINLSFKQPLTPFIG